MHHFISELDSQRFGINTARINEFNKEPYLIIKELKEINVKLVISRINANEIDLINKMEDSGFRLKDTQLILEHSLDNLGDSVPEPIRISEIRLRKAILSDAEKIAILARNSFQEYGHYYNNRFLPKSKTKDVYYDWAYRSCVDQQYADMVIVAEKNEEIIGFVGIKWGSQSDDIIAKLTLGAIADQFRNIGLFKLIINKCLLIAKEYPVKKVTTNVLINNIPVNISLNKIGFRPSGAEHTFHCWIENL